MVCRRTPLLSWVYCHSGRNISRTHNEQKPQLYFLNGLYWRSEEGDLTELQSVFLLFKNLWHLEVQRYHRRTNILSLRNTVTHTHSWPSHMPWIPCHAQVEGWVPIRDFPEFCIQISVLFFSWAFLILVEIFFHYSFVAVVNIDCQLCKT